MRKNTIRRSVEEYYGDYPCHRVVNHAGRLAPNLAEQKDLLLAEGVHFKASGCVDMENFHWKCEAGK